MAINSARQLAADLGARLLVLWVMDDGCRCAWGQMFTATNFEIRDVTPSHYLVFLSKLKRRISFAGKFVALLEPIFALRIVDSMVVNKWAVEKVDIVRKLGSRRKLCLSSWHAFYGNCSFRGYTPIESLRQRIDSQTAWGDRTVVGVHVRRTDNVAAIDSSPLELYVERMKSYGDQVEFFLASDSPEVKNELCRQFGGRIITPSGDLSRDSRSGMQQAVVELFALSRCSELIASNWSSFSDAAADIGSILAVKIIKK